MGCNNTVHTIVIDATAIFLQRDDQSGTISHHVIRRNWAKISFDPSTFMHFDSFDYIVEFEEKEFEVTY